MIGEILQAIKDALLELGPVGMILIATLDSSFLSIPEINDVIVVTRILHDPAEIALWPLWAAVGSVLGCLLLYTLARMGGDAFVRARFPAERWRRVERLPARYGLFTLLVPALCPPPMPFKIFVAMAGALRYPRTRFLLTILIARALRYYAEGMLAVLYGRAALRMLRDHWGTTALALMAASALGYGIGRALSRHSGDLPSLAKHDSSRTENSHE